MQPQAAVAEDAPAEESEAVPEEALEDAEDTPADEGEEEAPAEDGETPAEDGEEEALAEEEPGKEVDDIAEMEQELADAAG